jgi:hypothetical protein
LTNNFHMDEQRPTGPGNCLHARQPEIGALRPSLDRDSVYGISFHAHPFDEENIRVPLGARGPEWGLRWISGKSGVYNPVIARAPMNEIRMQIGVPVLYVAPAAITDPETKRPCRIAPWMVWRPTICKKKDGKITPPALANC